MRIKTESTWNHHTSTASPPNLHHSCKASLLFLIRFLLVCFFCSIPCQWHGTRYGICTSKFDRDEHVLSFALLAVVFGHKLQLWCLKTHKVLPGWARFKGNPMNSNYIIPEVLMHFATGTTPPTSLLCHVCLDSILLLQMLWSVTWAVCLHPSMSQEKLYKNQPNLPIIIRKIDWDGNSDAHLVFFLALG